MKKIFCLNKISEKGTNELGEDYELTDNMDEALGVLVRSADMKEIK